jgi:hypothetical protein
MFAIVILFLGILDITTRILASARISTTPTDGTMKRPRHIDPWPEHKLKSSITSYKPNQSPTHLALSPANPLTLHENQHGQHYLR